MFARRLRMVSAGLLFCTGVAFSVLTTGCASAPYQIADKVSSSRSDFKAQLDTDKTQIDTTIAALNNLSGKQGNDLVSAYKDYTNQLDKLQSAADASRNKMADLKSVTNDYYTAAQTKVDTITDPTLKSRATSRLATTLELANKANQDAKSVNLAGDAFLAQLRDIRAYLDADLTPASVASINDMVARANDQAVGLKAKIDGLSADIDAISATGQP